MMIRLPMTACALTAAFLVPPAAALTAPELWEEWQASLGLLGQEVEIANQSYSGGVLRLEGITQRMPIDPEIGRNITFIDALVLTEQPDSSVRIEIEGGYRIDFGGVSGPDRSDGSLSIQFEGLESFARGVPGEITYDFAADLAEMSLDELAYNGDPVPVEFNLAATGLTSETQQVASLYSGTGQVDALALSLRASDQAGSGVSLDYGLTALEFSGSADYADFAAMGVGDPSSVFRSETPSEVTTTHGPASFQIATQGPEGSGTVAGRAQSGALEGSFGAGRALYGAGVSGLELDIASPDMPFPINITADEMAFRAEGPMLAGDEPQPFATALNLAGLRVPDALWSMIDPNALLPRDPAALSLQLSGLVQLDRDFSDPDFADSQTPPGDLLALALERLDLAIAGAEATASGNFAMDPDGPPMMPGMPAASGQLNIEMRGVTGLLQNLTTLGILDPANAMGAQMMLGMIAQPSPDGSDTLTSVIELGADGSITANGTRIR
ncbi:MAG: DUF2125 domain-containing protein [Dinoroseobacter sp.]|nr:DUF2125 domain-containing protein [Dinoroseobacter sp.]